MEETNGKKTKSTAAERIERAKANKLRMRDMIIRTVEEKLATSLHYGMTVEQTILEECLRKLRDTVVRP